MGVRVLKFTAILFQSAQSMPRVNLRDTIRCVYINIYICVCVELVLYDTLIVAPDNGNLYVSTSGSVTGSTINHGFNTESIIIDIQSASIELTVNASDTNALVQIAFNGNFAEYTIDFNLYCSLSGLCTFYLENYCG